MGHDPFQVPDLRFERPRRHRLAAQLDRCPHHFRRGAQPVRGAERRDLRRRAARSRRGPTWCRPAAVCATTSSMPARNVIAPTMPRTPTTAPMIAGRGARSTCGTTRRDGEPHTQFHWQRKRKCGALASAAHAVLLSIDGGTRAQSATHPTSASTRTPSPKPTTSGVDVDAVMRLERRARCRSESASTPRRHPRTRSPRRSSP